MEKTQKQAKKQILEIRSGARRGQYKKLLTGLKKNEYRRCGVVKHEDGKKKRNSNLIGTSREDAEW
jgi:hypothetical protein